MIRCLQCGAETSNGLALCELCQRKVSTDLEYLPIYFRNLARWRPGHTGSRQVPGSRVLYDGTFRDADSTGDKISDRLAEALTMLTTWAKTLVDDRPHFPRPLTLPDAVLTGDLPDALAERLTDRPAEAVASLCQAFEHHLTSLSTLDWCGEFVRDISRHEAVLCVLTEQSAPGWYAGACRHCTLPTYVLPGFTWVTCQGCGAVTYARDHLEIILEEARDWVARPKALAEAIVALVDTEMSVPRLYTRIRQWAFVGDIEPIQHSGRGYEWSDHESRVVVVDQPIGHARYRFGDVFDRTMDKRQRAVTRPSGVA